jgi:hypothetical protein
VQVANSAEFCLRMFPYAEQGQGMRNVEALRMLLEGDIPNCLSLRKRNAGGQR